ncbi:MAG TPA: AMP-binding protein, partial [Bacillota bacterium]|nr:AMP-binding protein [Bacillota bacterium]
MTIVKGQELGEVKRFSLNELFWNAVNAHPEIPAACYRLNGEFKSLSYREFGDQVKALSQGLLSLGIAKGDKISLLAQTRYEWALADFAILTA